MRRPRHSILVYSGFQHGDRSTTSCRTSPPSRSRLGASNRCATTASSVISAIGSTPAAASVYVTGLAYFEFVGGATIFTTSALFASFGPLALVPTVSGYLAYEVLQ